MASKATETTGKEVKKTTRKTGRKKVKRTVPNALVYIKASYNNTLICLTDAQGNVLANISAGSCGFKGNKKGTGYAAQIASERLGQKAKNIFGVKVLDIFVQGIGQGNRDAAVRALMNLNFQVKSLTDLTTVPHGGVRPRKAKRK